jgi:hypothetical protein
MRMFGRSVSLLLGFATMLAALSVGCTVNLAEASAGEVGCPAHEIAISQDRMGEGTRSWTASCRGEVFYCSAAGTGNGTAQYQCSPALPAMSYRKGPAPVAPPAAEEEEKPFPEKALGFQFSTAPADAQAACSAQGHEWQAEGKAYACSGAGVEMGMPISTKLAYCGGNLCEIRAFAPLEPGSVGSSQLAKLRRALFVQYGVPDREDSQIPAECKENLIGCIAEKKASWSATWEWADGSVIRARAGGDGAGAVLGLLYRVDDPGELLNEASEGGLNAEAL